MTNRCVAFLLGLTIVSQAGAQRVTLTRERFQELTNIAGVTCSGDGQVCVNRNVAGSVLTVTEAATGLTLRELNVPTFLFSPTLALSFDGRLLAVGYGSNPFAVLGVWDVSTGNRVFQRTRPFEQDPQHAVAAMAFTRNGKYLAYVSQTGEAEVWDTMQWRIVDSIEGFDGTAREIEFSSDRELVVYQAGGAGQAWTLGSGKIREHASNAMDARPPAATAAKATPFDSFSTSFELTSDDRLLLPGTPGRVFDLRQGSFERLPSMTEPSSSVDGFDVSGTRAYAVWDWLHGYLVANDTLQPIAAPTWDTARTLAVSRDGKFVAVKRGTKVAIISVVDKSEKEYDLGIKFEHLRFSEAGTALIVSSDETGISAIAVDTGKPVWLPRLYEQDTLRDDLKYAVQVRSAGTNYFIRVFDVQSRRALYELPLDAAEHPSFSAQGNLVAVPLRSGGIVVLDLVTQRRVASLSGFPNEIVADIRFSSDGRRLVASGQRSFIRVWDLSTQSELLGLSLQGLNWAVFTPSGYYDGNEEELKNFYWVRGSKTTPLSAVQDHRVPGLAAKVWLGQQLPQGATAYASAMSGTDLPTLELLPGPKQTAASSTVTVRVRVHGGPEGPISVTGTRNGVPLRATANPAEPGVYSVDVKLENGSDRIVVWASDSMDRLSSEIWLNRDFVDRPKPLPEIVTQSPQDSLQLVAFSRDGSMMATARGHAITLWDMRTKRQLRTILDHANTVDYLVFGTSNATFASSAPGEGVRVWSTSTGGEVCRISTLSNMTPSIPFAISPDGQLIAVADSASWLVRVFHYSDCTEVASFEAGSVAPVWATDHTLLMQGSTKTHNELVAVNVNSGNEVRSEAATELKSITPLQGGSALLLLKGGKLQMQSQADELQPFPIDPKLGDKVNQVFALPSGRVFFDLGTKYYLLAPDLKTVETSWKGGYLASATASTDERWLGMVDTLGNLTVYNRLAAEKELMPSPESLGPVTQLVFSPAGDALATGRGSADPALPGSIQFSLWDLATSTVVRTIAPLKSTAALPTTNWLLTTGFGRIGITAVDGIETMPLTLEMERVQNGQLSVVQFQVDQQHPIKATLPASKSGSILSMQGPRLSGSATVAAVAGAQPGQVLMIDIATDRPIGSFRAHAGRMAQAAVSPDGEFVLTYGDGAEGNSVRLWKKDGTPVWRLEGQSSSLPALGFSGDNKLVAIAADGVIQVVDASTGVIKNKLAMEPAQVTALAFAPGNQRLAAGTADGLTHLYDCNSGRRLVTLVSEADGELAYTPDAFYTGTLTKSAVLSFRLDNHVYPLQQFDLYYNRPDLLMQAMAPELQPVIRAYKVVREKRLKEANVTDADLPPTEGLPVLAVTAPPSTTVSSRSLALPVTAHAVNGVPLSYIEVRVNGVPDPPVSVRGRKGFDSILPIVLSSGRNDVEITAIDMHRQRSLTQELTIQYAAGTSPTLYLVPVGLSLYGNPAKNLGFAAKDATDLANYFRDLKNESALPVAFDKVVVIGPLTDANATRENIMKTHDALSQAGVDDIVVLFFAGHGLLDNKLDFYFAPYDMDFAVPSKFGISIAEMEALIGNSRSRKRLLLVDACHSGELDKSGVASTAFSSAAPAGSRGSEIVVDPDAINAFELLRSLFVDLRENTGTEIISASRGQELAHELDNIRNGVFTRSVLEGLQGAAADEDHDGHVSVSELLDFVSTRVEELSHGNQTPTRRQQNIEQDFQVE